ncbi:MAG: cyclic nucleotide-binding domain-containing protein [Candidatus Riflebacteria bacterium]
MESKVREYQKGSAIFHRGEAGNTAYILTEGTVEIAIFEGKNKTVLSIIKPVSVFGEMALLSRNQQRTATATTLSVAKVAEISRKDFEDFFNKSPKLISAVLKAMVDRLEQTNARVSQSPELYTAITETLNLLVLHDRLNRIRYDSFIECIAASFKLELPEIRKSVDFLETIGLIEVRTDGDNRMIDIIRPIDFIDRARKIYKTFAKMGSSPDAGVI